MQQSSSNRWLRGLATRRTGSLLPLSAILGVALATLVLIAPASATDTSARPEPNYNVKMAARSFYDGNFKYGDWLPIEISLENFGEALDAQVETTIASNFNGTSLNTTFRREVSLGQRANKRFTLYIQPFVQTTNVSRSVSYEAKVVLKTDDQKLDEKAVKLQPINPTDYLVGAVVTDPNALAGMNNLKVGALRSRILAVPLTLSDIPDRAEGLRSLSSLIISETATDGLNGAQRDAIKDWVNTGGQLLLMGGNGWGRVREAFDSSFVPFDVLDFVNITDVSALLPVPGERATLSRPVAMARGQVLQGAKALAYGPPGANGAAPTPLVAERRVGAGRVIATAIDLTLPLVLDWTGSSRVWQELFNFNASGYNTLYNEQNPQLKNAADFLGFISSVPELQVPDLLPFLLIFGAYILVVGPLNFVFLRRIGRLEWAWGTIPAGILLCTGLTLYITNSQPPGQVLISQMSMVEVAPGQDTAQVRSYAAVFSPEDRRYQVAPEPRDGLNASLLLPLNRSGSSGTNDTDSINRVIVQGDRARMDGLPIGQWAAQGFSTEASIPSRSLQLSSDLYFQQDDNQPDNAKIVGTIRNTTGTTLRNSLLILGDTPIKLKDTIEPGEAVPVEFGLPSPTGMAPAFCSNSYTSYGSFPPQSPGDRIASLLRGDRPDRRDDRLIANRAGFLKKMFESGRYSPLDPNRGLDFIGWMDQNPLPLSVDGVTVQAKTSQVLVTRLPISSQRKDDVTQFFLPGSYFWPENATNETGLSALTNRTDRDDEVCITKGSVVAQYRLPVEQGTMKANRMALYLNSVTSSSQRSPVLPDRIELYDWQAGKWQQLNGLANSALPQNNSTGLNSPTPKRNEIPNASRYVDPMTGRILLRFSTDSSTLNLLTQFSLTVEGARQ